MKKLLTLGLALALALQLGCASTNSPTPTGRHAEKPLTGHERAILLLDLAAANLAEGDATQALQALTESKSLDDEIAETYYLFALAYHQKNELALAISSARQAVEMKPEFSKAKNTLGKLLMDAGKFDESEKVLKEAVSDLLFTEAYLAKANLGILYYKKMNPAKAEPLLTQALREGGDQTCLAAYYRGMIYLDQNKLDYASADFSRASRSGCSRITEAHLAKGQTLIRMKKYDQARAKMLEIQQLFPMTDAYDRAGRYLKEIP